MTEAVHLAARIPTDQREHRAATGPLDKSSGPAPPDQDTSRLSNPPTGPTSEEQASTTLTMGEIDKMVAHPVEQDASGPRALSTAWVHPPVPTRDGAQPRGANIHWPPSPLAGGFQDMGCEEDLGK